MDPALTEWRFIGPGLGALIMALSLCFRAARPRLQEFLHDWLGIDLSIGTIHQAIHEAGAAVLPAEAELIAAVQASGQRHVDEMLWLEGRHTAWLWVFTAATVTLLHGSGRATHGFTDPVCRGPRLACERPVKALKSTPMPRPGRWRSNC